MPNRSFKILNPDWAEGSILFTNKYKGVELEQRYPRTFISLFKSF